jgi:hypothetical protein
MYSGQLVVGFASNKRIQNEAVGIGRSRLILWFASSGSFATLAAIRPLGRYT